MKNFVKNLKSLLNKSYLKYLIILTAFIVWMTFLDTNSLLIHAELNREIKKLKVKINALTEEINKDQSLIEKLDNIDSLEHYGRENYNLKRDEEDIYIIEYQLDNQ
ncbi:MAG: septum formation initiator family protein [Flavobacteriales bacterium]|nr:MAG: septum formation initiator family protein [Flavobacteriales bacterium]|tara:strand:- start:1493 stop:1810 length:318 start_codon:yes stop_codon:yes gene_type:complete